MISSSILSKPYLFGNPFVLDTVTVSNSCVPIPTDKEVVSVTTSGVRLSRSRYWSKFSAISTTPPWYSWEI